MEEKGILICIRHCNDEVMTLVSSTKIKTNTQFILFLQYTTSDKIVTTALRQHYNYSFWSGLKDNEYLLTTRTLLSL